MNIQLQPPTQFAQAQPVATPPATDSPATTIFIGYCNQSQDSDLAQHCRRALTLAGYRVWMIDEQTHFRDFSQQLFVCDYFLLILSLYSARNQLIEQKVQEVKARRERNADQKPIILPIRVNFPQETRMDYKLRGYLDRIQGHLHWRSDGDTSSVLKDLLSIVNRQQVLPMIEEALPIGTVSSSNGASASAAHSVSGTPEVRQQVFELPGGTVSIDSPFYLERPPIEQNCRDAILQASALIRIKAPRQMGKSSLMVRILNHAEQHNYRVASLSFQIADSRVFESLDRFLRWFCASIGKQLGLPNRLNELWDEETFGSMVSCSDYFAEHLLQEVDSLVLGLDEVDAVFEHTEIAQAFFGMLRNWHEESKTRPIWRKLRMVVTHSTEVFISLPVNQSPFNVGLAIELPEFNSNQVEQLSRLYELNWSPEQLVCLQKMVGGHPNLVRLAMHQVKSQNLTLEEVLRNASTQSGIYGDHLRRQEWHLQKYPELGQAFDQVLDSDQPIYLEGTIAFKLHSIGLVHLEGKQVRVRCELYRQYFRTTA